MRAPFRMRDPRHMAPRSHRDRFRDDEVFAGFELAQPARWNAARYGSAELVNPAFNQFARVEARWRRLVQPLRGEADHARANGADHQHAHLGITGMAIEAEDQTADRHAQQVRAMPTGA